MKYRQKSFTLPAVEKPPENCDHGWYDKRDCCVFCGVPKYAAKIFGPRAYIGVMDKAKSDEDAA